MAEYPIKWILSAYGSILNGRSILWVGYPPLMGDGRRKEYVMVWIPIDNGRIPAGRTT